MLQPIDYNHKGQIDLDKLKHEVDRRIEKITWLVNQSKQKKKNSKNKHSQQARIDIAIQANLSSLENSLEIFDMKHSFHNLQKTGTTNSYTEAAMNTLVSHEDFISQIKGKVEEVNSYQRSVDSKDSPYNNQKKTSAFEQFLEFKNNSKNVESIVHKIDEDQCV